MSQIRREDHSSAILKNVVEALTRAVSWFSSRANRSRILGARVQTIACILCRDTDIWILLGQSRYHNTWMPPQEGVDLDEDFEEAFSRCLKVECGLDQVAQQSLRVRSCKYVGQITLPKNRWGERPVADSVYGTFLESITLKAKAYWMMSAIVSRKYDIDPKPDGIELAKLSWHTLENARDLIQRTNHADKAELLMDVLSQCERDLLGAPRLHG